MKTLNQIFEEISKLDERISGKGTDRKAQLKRAFRAGQHKTDNFYGDRGRTNTIPAPKGMKKLGDYKSKHKDKGIEKAYNKGKHSDDSMSPAKGKERMKPQDVLNTPRKDVPKQYGKRDMFDTHPADRGKLPK
jgi:hypothetical protein